MATRGEANLSYFHNEVISRSLDSLLFVQDMLGTGSGYGRGSENEVAQAMWNGICAKGSKGEVQSCM